MSFIAINAKADVAGSKKGKLTPAQNAQINAFCLSVKTGILDTLDRCETTANFYSSVNNSTTVIFKRGFISICGRIIECEEGTQVRVATPTTGSVSGKIILRFDLGTSQNREFEVTTKTGDLVQEDLNEYQLTGVYEFKLYDYVATPTGITLSRENVVFIWDLNRLIVNYNAVIQDIEERLEEMGFNTAQCYSLPTVSGLTVEANIVEKSGKLAIIKNLKYSNSGNIWTVNNSNSTVTMNIGKVPYLPVEPVNFLFNVDGFISTTSGGGSTSFILQGNIDTEGNITATFTLANNALVMNIRTITIINVGYKILE